MIQTYLIYDWPLTYHKCYMIYCIWYIYICNMIHDTWYVYYRYTNSKLDTSSSSEKMFSFCLFTVETLSPKSAILDGFPAGLNILMLFNWIRVYFLSADRPIFSFSNICAHEGKVHSFCAWKSHSGTPAPHKWHEIHGHWSICDKTTNVAWAEMWLPFQTLQKSSKRIQTLYQLVTNSLNSQLVLGFWEYLNPSVELFSPEVSSPLAARVGQIKGDLLSRFWSTSQSQHFSSIDFTSDYFQFYCCENLFHPTRSRFIPLAPPGEGNQNFERVCCCSFHCACAWRGACAGSGKLLGWNSLDLMPLDERNTTRTAMCTFSSVELWLIEIHLLNSGIVDNFLPELLWSTGKNTMDPFSSTVLDMLTICKEHVFHKRSDLATWPVQWQQHLRVARLCSYLWGAFSWIFGRWTWGFIPVAFEGKMISLDCLKPCAVYNQQRERRISEDDQPFRLHVPPRHVKPKLWAPAWYRELTCARGYLSWLFRIVATSMSVCPLGPWISILAARWSSVCLIGTCFCSKGYCGQKFGPQWETPWCHYPLLCTFLGTKSSGWAQRISQELDTIQGTDIIWKNRTSIDKA